MSPHFHNYPQARAGPAVPYKKEDVALPVLRGPPLAIGATVYVQFNPSGFSFVMFPTMRLLI